MVPGEVSQMTHQAAFATSFPLHANPGAAAEALSRHRHLPETTCPLPGHEDSPNFPAHFIEH